MPTTVNIPSRVERHCEPCEFLAKTNILCSRLDGISCDFLCKNPLAFDDTPLSNEPEVAAKQGEMRARMSQHGRFIGRDDIQPKWCPLLRDKNK
jgi:hypothetical protein